VSAPERPHYCTIRERETGRRIGFWRKMAWSKWYYSFDGQENWHRSRVTAYRLAKENGKLEASV